MKDTTVWMAVIAASAATVLAMPQTALDDRIHVVLPRDTIPAISKPEFETLARAERNMSDDELMIGVGGEREQRAYSTWQLDRHEIVNDTFEGRPIAVT